MAVDVCSETASPTLSPRISFSHDLKELDSVPVESLHSVGFDFSIDQTSSHEISSADELFSDGKILPSRSRESPSKQSLDEPADENSEKKRLIEFLSTEEEEDDDDEEEEEEEEEEEDEEEEEAIPKTFWQFRSSSSVNCDRKPTSNDLIGRSLQFLTRSNSAPNPKPSGFSKVMQKQHSLKEPTINRRNSSAKGLDHQYYPYNTTTTTTTNNRNSNKPSLRASNSRSYGSGVRINPVLNIPPTYIAKGTVSLFGIGSFFCSKKSKKKKKKK